MARKSATPERVARVLPPYVTRVKSNLKFGLDVQLGPRTLIVGDNGMGKTSILTAVELALTGGCRKVGRKGSRLMLLVPGGEGELSVEAGLSDGSTVSFAVRGTTARASQPVWTRTRSDGMVEPVIRPLGAYLYHSTAEVLRGDPVQTLRPELLRAACGAVKMDELVRRHVPEVYVREWAAAWDAAAGDSTADRLATLAGELRAQARSAKKSAAVAEAAGEVLVEPSEEEIGAARAAITDVRKQEHVARLHAELAELRARLGEEVFVRGTDDDEMRVRLAATRGAVAIHDFYAVYTERGASLFCLACEGELPADLAALAARVRDRAQRVARTVARECGAALDRDTACARIAAIGDEFIRLGVEEGADADAPTADVSMLENALIALLQQRERARAARAVRDAAAAARQTFDAVKALSRAADAMVAEALEGGVRALEADVNRALGPDRVQLVLFDGGKPACRVLWTGRVGDREVTAPLQTLSGAQEVAVFRAFACAWAQHAGLELVRVVEVDDVAMRRPALERLCAGFDAAPGVQVFVSVADAYDYVPAGWTVVET